ncbi:lysophospholipid acyltransferase family protein [Anaerosacchariphilus polymeriproducens]|uniref:1-acyl-sn-glycerol-3-phosphate acyltransferase n=1 Tax=Anaerosacchariphilus polymeriproducens TaxID=1812858 RepID=A0A371AVC6_9FIRM|nr:lysophospholipid acyltransferase family protein [Anaerosacchariphilus polymeriproducens]RDU23534.1 1-acyl-sn-glycerol-3-phosphate acyltransferase [Anaerosacchariphilus polymeriproducens]
MNRIILMVLKNLFFAPFWFIKLCFYCRAKKYTEQQRFDLLKKGTKKANKGGRVIIEAIGLDNIPKENGYIMFPNHQGLYDVLAFLDVHPHPFSVIMKKEVEDIPFLKQIFICMRAYAIDREDVRKSMKIIMQVTKEVKEGRNFIIFAEGTRSKGNFTREFKGGSFKSAMNAKCPIVPVALINAFQPFDSNKIDKVIVKIQYLKPLYYDDYKNMKSVEIANYVKRVIDQALKENEEI